MLNCWYNDLNIVSANLHVLYVCNYYVVVVSTESTNYLILVSMTKIIQP